MGSYEHQSKNSFESMWQIWAFSLMALGEKIQITREAEEFLFFAKSYMEKGDYKEMKRMLNEAKKLDDTINLKDFFRVEK